MKVSMSISTVNVRYRVRYVVKCCQAGLGATVVRGRWRTVPWRYGCLAQRTYSGAPAVKGLINVQSLFSLSSK